MLLVAFGLATMFTIGGFLGLSAIDEAADLVFRERLATAYGTVAVVERDFSRVAADISLVATGPWGTPSIAANELADGILGHVGAAGRYPFFSVIAITLLDGSGWPIGSAGEVPVDARFPAGLPIAIPEFDAFRIERAQWVAPPAVAFVDLTVPVPDVSASEVGGVVAHTVSTNSSTPFDPSTHARTLGQSPASRSAGPLDTYNLEIIDTEGVTVLSLGAGSRAGEPTSHLRSIEDMLAAGAAGALIDDSAAQRHVMAGVPIEGSPLFLVLEQPVDVALALPNQLRERLFVLIGVGFLGALAVAWVTTRRVVKPTEELTVAASRMAQGDLTQPINVAAYDEVASLAETLELMRQRLLHAQGQLVEVNKDLELRIQERTARLGYVLRKTISAQEDERHALARELHDETAQTLAALTIALDRARLEVPVEPDHGLARIDEAKTIAARALIDTRRLIMGLRPAILDDLGLGPAISAYAETVMLERDQPTEVTVVVPPERLPRHLEVALFRIAQEGLNNIAKHAGASMATVTCELIDDDVELVVADDGVGFDVEVALVEAARSGDIGLAGMQERVALLGGSMTITSEPGSGSEIRMRAPTSSEGP